MALRGLGAFKTGMHNAVACVEKSERETVLRQLYSLLKEHQAKENAKSRVTAVTPRLRENRRRFDNAARHVENALTSLEKAAVAMPQHLPDLRTEPEFESAASNLKDLSDGLRRLEGRTAGRVYSDLRTPAERKKAQEVGLKWHSLVPDFGIAKVDYWFIDKAVQLLRTFRDIRGKQVSLESCDAILERGFSQGLGQIRDRESVKTARLRMQKRRAATASLK